MSHNVTSEELRKFGLIMAFILIGMIGCVFPYFFEHEVSPLPWALGTAFLIAAILVPNRLRLVYTLWMKLGHLLGFINTRIILGIIFFLVITPIGLLMRLMKKDPMNKRWDSTIPSYRKSITPPPIQHMEKPF